MAKAKVDLSFLQGMGINPHDEVTVHVHLGRVSPTKADEMIDVIVNTLNKTFPEDSRDYARPYSD